jgi:hypothetical protein
LLDEPCAALEVALELDVEAVESDDGAGAGVVIAELDGVEEVTGGGSDDDFVGCRSPQAPSKSTALIASIDVESFMAFPFMIDWIDAANRLHRKPTLERLSAVQHRHNPEASVGRRRHDRTLCNAADTFMLARSAGAAVSPRQ